MNAAFSSLLTLFSSALVLHTLDRAIAYCMCISLSQQIGSNCTSPFNAGEMFRIRNTFVLTVIGASDEVLYPLLQCSEYISKMEVHMNSFATDGYMYCGCLWRFVELRF